MARTRNTMAALVRRSKVVRDTSQRFVDVALRFEIVDGPDAGTLLDPYGGRWDKLRGEYVTRWDHSSGRWHGDPVEHEHIVRVAAQCVPYIEDWQSAIILAEGGRRSGKTTGALAPKMLICLIEIPGKPGGVLSPTYKQTKNVRKAVLMHTPRHWWEKWPQPKTPPITLTTILGSSATMLSADNEDSARSEGVAWFAYDERQDIGDDAASNAMLSTSEGGENPYIFETATIKPELRQHHDALVASPDGQIYPMDSYGNPFINHRFLDLARELLDEETIDREIRAKWPELFGRIFHNFDADIHVRAYPDRARRDVTQAFLGERYGLPQAGNHAPLWFISIDPPWTAALWRFYDDDTMHMVHEVLVGADGHGGGVEEMAARVHALVGDARAVIVQDPHEHKWDSDVVKHFKRLGKGQYRFVHLRHLPVIYKHASVRAMLKRGKLLISPNCPHAIEVLTRHTYKANGSGNPDTMQRYDKSHQRDSKRVLLVHLGDVIGYACYKINPTRLDYASMEKTTDAS